MGLVLEAIFGIFFSGGIAFLMLEGPECCRVLKMMVQVWCFVNLGFRVFRGLC